MILLILIGGFFGACLRYVINGWLSKYNQSFPLSTLVINLIGSSLIGLSAGIGIKQGSGIHMFTVIGALGAFTTFSTFAIEALELLLSKKHRTFWIYSCFSLVGSFLCCLVCYLLMKNMGY